MNVDDIYNKIVQVMYLNYFIYYLATICVFFFITIHRTSNVNLKLFFNRNNAYHLLQVML